jgi:type VI secretion system protein VasJ
MPAHVLGDDFDKCCNRFADGTPYGEDVKFDPLFQDLKAEVLKLTAHSSLEGGVDWKSVKARSVEILATKSKDLTVASYLTLALFVLDGYGGLADGVGILQKYVQDEWDGIFPAAARPRNRALALEWLVTRLAPFVELKAPEAPEAAIFPDLQKQVAALQEAIRSRLQHEAPSFSDLNAALSSHAAGLPAGTPAPVSASPVAQALAPVAAPAEPEVAPGTPAAEIEGRIRTLIPSLRQAEPFSPIPYRMLRSLKWDGVAALPPLDPNSANPGTTRIPPPRAQQRTALENLHAAGHWAELLRASEVAFQDGTGTFWLDLQRDTVAALEGLDSGAGARAAEAVKSELARLLDRLKMLPTLYFADRTLPNPTRPTERTIERTPFASDETRHWLESLKGDAAGGAEPGAIFLPPARAAEDGAPALSPADAQTVRDLLARQQSSAAFDILQNAVEKASSQRSRFLTRLAAARLCLQANQAAWARALLEELLRESETFHFEDWEPETAVDLYQLLALCCSRPAKKGGPADPEAARVQVENLRRKLFRLDMRAAAVLEEALKR